LTWKGMKDSYAQVTREKLKEVVFSFQKDKSPGPDRWLVDFFRAFYEWSEDDILSVIEESRSFGKVLSALNATFIALIPKKDNPNSFKDFWPISSCNSIYKIVAKVTARRHKSVLSSVVSKEQNRFLEGRQIHDVIGVAQEGLHSIKVKKIPSMVLKIDLSKAYNHSYQI
jgi:hypothetical protein